MLDDRWVYVTLGWATFALMIRDGHEVPVLTGTSIRPCKRCNLWFAAGKRMRVCDGCQPKYKLALRGSVTASNAKAYGGGTGTRVSSVGEANEQVSDLEIRALRLNK